MKGCIERAIYFVFPKYRLEDRQSTSKNKGIMTRAQQNEITGLVARRRVAGDAGVARGRHADIGTGHRGRVRGRHNGRRIGRSNIAGSAHGVGSGGSRHGGRDVANANNGGGSLLMR